MTPQAVAHNVAAYYRENPKRNWRQGSFGSRMTGCCLYGAVRYGFTSDDVNAFCEAVQKVVGEHCGQPSVTLVYFNDHIAKSVDDVLAVLDRVARS